MARTSSYNSSATFGLDKSDRDNFERLYPCCFPIFLRRAVKLACINKDFFNTVFWSESKDIVDGPSN